MRDHYDVVVVGAGFAGAATAAHLMAEGVSDLVVLDREATAGAHSSGRNAGMVRRAAEDSAITPLAVEGAGFIRELADDVPFRETGSYLLGARSRIDAHSLALFPHTWRSPSEAHERVALLSHVSDVVLETPHDGIVEVHALLQHYLATVRSGGGQIALGVENPTPITGKSAGGEDQVTGVRVGERLVHASHVVCATGAWGREWGDAVGAPIRLVPRRRHIVCTAAPEGTPPWHWPWVWDLETSFYFRPEAGGLLWSPCDECAQEPCSALPDPAAPRWLAEKLEHAVPAAAGLSVGQHWAGHRTFTPDGRFLLGPDPRVKGWHWAVGLGGHGVTVSSAIGRRVAGGITGSCEIEAAHAFRASVVAAGPVVAGGERW